jgi:hypothetical protein
MSVVSHISSFIFIAQITNNSNNKIVKNPDLHRTMAPHIWCNLRLQLEKTAFGVVGSCSKDIRFMI